MDADRHELELRVLLLAPTQRDAAASAEVLRSAGVSCSLYRDLPTLCRDLELGAAVVVVPESVLPEAQSLERIVRERPVWSDIPIVVLSRAGSEQPMLAEATRRLGNVTVIERPVRVSTLLSVIQGALRARQRQYQIRDYLESQEANQAALKRSELRFRELADAMPQIVWTARPDGYLDYYNERWYEFTGFPRGQCGDESWKPILHPDDVQRCADTWYSCVRAGEPYEIEYRFIDRTTGTYRWFLGRALPVKAQSGLIEKWYGSCTDIDDQKRAEERAREEGHVVETISFVGRTLAAELNLPTLVQTVIDATTELTDAQIGVFFYHVLDESGQSHLHSSVSGVNRARFDNLPLPRITELFAPTFRGDGVIRLADVTLDPRYGKNEPHSGLPAGCSPVRSYMAVPVASRSGEVVGALLFGHEMPDVFDERDEQLVVGVAAQAAVAIDNARLFNAAKRANQAKDELLSRERSARIDAEKANRMKDEFLSIVSHELRTPLNAILGWSQILRTADPSGPDLAEGLDVIERNARVQAQIIEDLLDMSRIISGKVRLDLQRVDLPAVVDTAVESMRPSAVAKGVSLHKVLDPLAGPVSGDPSRLQQVIWNLISNAIKFTPSGGRVAVALERLDSHVEISVSDTGEGIKHDFLPSVFDRFRQAEGATTRRHGGLGLGLSIVKQLTELHGGTVSAKSPGEGQGATFRVALPLAALREQDGQGDRPAPQSKNNQAHAEWEAPSLREVSVLMVDDEPDSRRLIGRVLEKCDAVVTPASSAAEALTLLNDRRFDVIVSDIGMPGIDGYEFIRRIRSLPIDKTSRTPAIALTAFARSEDRTRAMLCGFDLHISKPVEPGELCAVVARLAGRVG
ncbi:hypothetical protein BH09PLA1_BH09PLA1_34150 [soil metagenome]